MTPKISVVVPTFNEEQNIVNCLESLQKQTIPRDSYEIIVVDGNSKDKTRDLAEPLADIVMIQTSKKVGGARNDGAAVSSADIIATTDADCVIPEDWLEKIIRSFEKDGRIVQLYGTVLPLEPGIKFRFYLALANIFSRIGYYTHTLYYTLGCNTAFTRNAYMQIGGYKCIDAGDDLEIAQRMRKIGKVKLNSKLWVKFSMRRYVQFGTLKSLYVWLYIVFKGGDSEKYSYAQREYK
ncbi:glycosyl transferase family 2 [Methanolacinia petrolearia DSM 11571]|uniref:Glycosyl transferase family 2 n=1 Tax=Methanolacinia petrolearia (strain DSM 11571 / OCM 486 / SEBR 4847) TaxID=679926 RepID=E1RI48_METP4|nr:glycosyltransferase [Methanolacinia petrolearia]ADN35433.1 glycosyl transferase family 2 [Methanolacinia petrolearia DSM 11571]